MHSKQATSTQSIVLETLAVLVALATVLVALPVLVVLALVVPVALVLVALVVLAVLALVALVIPVPQQCLRLEPCMHGTSDTHAGSATRTVHTPPSSVADASSLLSLRDTTTLASVRAALGRTT